MKSGTMYECDCGWVGDEDELEVDYIDSCNDSNALADRCPDCNDEIGD